MQTEIEAKFLNVSHDEIRKKLQELGAECVQPMRLMRRAMFDYPDLRFKENSMPERLRVRDEGDKVTMTYKIDRSDSNYAYEAETVVGSFEEAVEILKAIGLVQTSIMESKRETWHLNEVEIVLDEWPWINPYIEIEGNSEQKIMQFAHELGLDWSDAKFGPVDTVYKLQYPGMKKGESIGDFKVVAFDMNIPEFFLERIG